MNDNIFLENLKAIYPHLHQRQNGKTTLMTTGTDSYDREFFVPDTFYNRHLFKNGNYYNRQNGKINKNAKRISLHSKGSAERAILGRRERFFSPVIFDSAVVGEILRVTFNLESDYKRAKSLKEDLEIENDRLRKELKILRKGLVKIYNKVAAKKTKG